MVDSPRVLVCEDNRVMGNVLFFALDREGYDVTLARTGTESVERVTNERWDFVLTDHQMPGASGIDVVRALRATPGGDVVPVLFCTAKGLELDVAAMKDELGIIDLVFKPFSTTEIQSIIRDTLAAAAV